MINNHLLNCFNKAWDSTSLGVTYRSCCFNSLLYPFQINGSNQLIREISIKVHTY